MYISIFVIVNISKKRFLREMMNLLVPKKHLGKSFPQICSLKKLSSSVVSGKPNSHDYGIYVHLYFRHCEY